MRVGHIQVYLHGLVSPLTSCHAQRPCVQGSCIELVEFSSRDGVHDSVIVGTTCKNLSSSDSQPLRADFRVHLKVGSEPLRPACSCCLACCRQSQRPMTTIWQKAQLMPQQLAGIFLFCVSRSVHPDKDTSCYEATGAPILRAQTRPPSRAPTRLRHR